LDPGGITDQRAAWFNQRALGAAVGAVYGSHDRRVAVNEGVQVAAAGTRLGGGL
jgi:hypothetical protein